MTQLREEFWDRMDDVQAGMLGLKNSDRLVPMSPNVHEGAPGHIWFITAAGTDLAEATEVAPQPAHFVVADGSAGLYADIEGTLAQVVDKETLDEIWSIFAAAWFEDGRDDPDVRLLRFSPVSTDMSVTPTSGAKFLYEITKGNLTAQKPDMGDSGSVTF